MTTGATRPPKRRVASSKPSKSASEPFARLPHPPARRRMGKPQQTTRRRVHLQRIRIGQCSAARRKRRHQRPKRSATLVYFHDRGGYEWWRPHSETAKKLRIGVNYGHSTLITKIGNFKQLSTTVVSAEGDRTDIAVARHVKDTAIRAVNQYAKVSGWDQQRYTLDATRFDEE